MLRQPWLVSSPTLAPLPSSSALVATVVPCSTASRLRGSSPALAQTSTMPLMTPSAWFAGVDGVFASQKRERAES